MNARRLFLRCLIFLGVIAVLYVASVFTIGSGADESGAESTDIDTTIKQIASVYLRETIEASETFDEAVEKVGIDSDRFIQLCLALDVTYDFPSIEPPVAPQVEPVPLPLAEKVKLPDYQPSVVFEYSGISPTYIIVDKTSHLLYLFQNEDGVRSLVATFECKTGMITGDKKEEGDHKTPEGVYFFVNHYSRNDLRRLVGVQNAFQYGNMAFTTDFPNPIDRFEGKNGSGIWLHGTDEEFDKTSPFDTRGCVVVKNDAIDFLQDYITLNATPMIIVDELEVAEKTALESGRASILGLIEDWRSSWESKNIDSYIGHYAASFRAQGMNRAQWKERKQSLAGINGNVTIKLDDISIFQYNHGVIVQFVQDYSASNTSGKGIKTLYLVPGEGNKWQIVDEEFRKL